MARLRVQYKVPEQTPPEFFGRQGAVPGAAKKADGAAKKSDDAAKKKKARQP